MKFYIGIANSGVGIAIINQLITLALKAQAKWLKC